MKQKSTLWGSISLLIGVVIAVLALVRGKWLTPLLIAVFAVWGLWVILALLLPAWRSVRTYRRRERKAKRREQELSGVPNVEMSQTLLHHVNHRISSYLKAAYPNARWEWMMDDPALFTARGGTGRIRVYAIPDFEFADVTMDRKGNLACSLVKVVPVHSGAEQPASPNQQPVDPQVWYELEGREMLERLVADLNSRGHSGLMLKEDGSICVQQEEDGKAVTQDTFHSFPAKVYWPRLVKVLEQAGLAATEEENCITLAW